MGDKIVAYERQLRRQSGERKAFEESRKDGKKKSDSYNQQTHDMRKEMRDRHAQENKQYKKKR